MSEIFDLLLCVSDLDLVSVSIDICVYIFAIPFSYLSFSDEISKATAIRAIFQLAILSSG